MEIVVMSDSHGAFAPLQKVVKRHRDADVFLHLGDGEREMARLLEGEPALAEKFYYLKGNCDGGAAVPGTRRRVTLELPYGHRLLASHGDWYRVKYGTARLVTAAREAGADIVLYGHTHRRDCRYEDGLYIVNPGSLGQPRDGEPPGYALISISGKGILANVVSV